MVAEDGRAEGVGDLGVFGGVGEGGGDEGEEALGVGGDGEPRRDVAEGDERLDGSERPEGAEGRGRCLEVELDVEEGGAGDCCGGPRDAGVRGMRKAVKG